MKVKVIAGWRGASGYRVQLTQEHQSFKLDFEGSRVVR